MADVPQAFQERLLQVDPLLYAEWDSKRSRWWILRRNPKRPLQPDKLVLVREPDGGYRPLDQRTIDKLYQMDLWRRFVGTANSQGAKLERELNSMQADLDAAKKKKADEEHQKRIERMAWYDNYYGRETQWHDLFRPGKKEKVRIPKSL